MFTVLTSSGELSDYPKPYPTRDDALRYVNAVRKAPVATGDAVLFEIVSDDGRRWCHGEIIDEIALRPELREPQRIR
jgi:hypothetical protein